MRSRGWLFVGGVIAGATAGWKPALRASIVTVGTTSAPTFSRTSTAALFFGARFRGADTRFFGPSPLPRPPPVFFRTAITLPSLEIRDRAC